MGNAVTRFAAPVSLPGSAALDRADRNPWQGEDIDARVRDSVGLRLRPQDREAVGGWVAARAEAAGIGLDAWWRLVASPGDSGLAEREALSVRLTTGETYFWRDSGLFELIRTTLLPELLAQRRGERRLRLWSAGCATGEEAYTLAMLLHEHRAELAGWDLRIVATDINSAALAAAREGRYGEWSLRATDAACRARYFRRCGRHWALDERILKMVEFRHADLLDGDGGDDPGPVDLLLCRNVFIYMDTAAVARAARRLSRAVAHGGYLITGHGELIGHAGAGLHARVFPASVVLHKGPAAEVAPLAALLRPDPPPGTPPRPAAGSGTAPCDIDVPPPDAGDAGRPAATDLEALLSKAWRHADRGESDRARVACADAMARAPLDPRAYYLVAQLAKERGDGEQLRRMIDRVLYLDQAHVAAWLDQAVLHERAGDIPASRRALQNALAVLAALAPEVLVEPFETTSAGELHRYVASRLAALEAGNG